MGVDEVEQLPKGCLSLDIAKRMVVFGEVSQLDSE